MSAYTVQHKQPRNPVMSDGEIRTLPGWAQAVILHQRELEQFCSGPVVDFKQAVGMLERRNFLARSAAKIWSGSDKPRM